MLRYLFGLCIALVYLSQASAQSVGTSEVDEGHLHDNLESRQIGRPRFFLYAGLGLGKPILSKNTLGVPQAGWDNLVDLQLEVSIPRTPYTLSVGYARERLRMMGPHYYLDNESMELGARYYLSPANSILQAYLGASVLGRTSTRYQAKGDSFWQGGDLSWTYQNRFPEISLSPLVGVDVYVFSSLALSFSYGLRLGLGSGPHLRAEAPTYSLDIGGTGVRHHVAAGLKLSIPVRWSREDGQLLRNNLWNMLLDRIFFF